MLFEMLDKDKEGKISAQSFCHFLKMVQKLNKHKFDIDVYIQNELGVNEGDDDVLNQGEADDLNMDATRESNVEKLIANFDVDNDGAIGPTEFFNIIMAFYE